MKYATQSSHTFYKSLSTIKAGQLLLSTSLNQIFSKDTLERGTHYFSFSLITKAASKLFDNTGHYIGLNSATGLHVPALLIGAWLQGYYNCPPQKRIEKYYPVASYIVGALNGFMCCYITGVVAKSIGSNYSALAAGVVLSSFIGAKVMCSFENIAVNLLESVFKTEENERIAQIRKAERQPKIDELKSPSQNIRKRRGSSSSLEANRAFVNRKSWMISDQNRSYEKIISEQELKRDELNDKVSSFISKFNISDQNKELISKGFSNVPANIATGIESVIMNYSLFTGIMATGVWSLRHIDRNPENIKSCISFASELLSSTICHYYSSTIVYGLAASTGLLPTITIPILIGVGAVCLANKVIPDTEYAITNLWNMFNKKYDFYNADTITNSSTALRSSKNVTFKSPKITGDEPDVVVFSAHRNSSKGQSTLLPSKPYRRNSTPDAGAAARMHETAQLEDSSDKQKQQVRETEKFEALEREKDRKQAIALEKEKLKKPQTIEEAKSNLERMNETFNRFNEDKPIEVELPVSFTRRLSLEAINPSCCCSLKRS